MSIYDKASLVLIPSGTKTSKVYSQKPVNGDGDFTFSRSTAATRVNADGNIEKETQNLLLQSNGFDQLGWATSSLVVNSGYSGYDGTNDAYRLNATAASGFLRQELAINGVLSASIYAKKNTADGIRVRFDHNTDTNVYVDLRDGSLVTSGNTIDINIEDASNGWYKITFAFNASGMVRIQLYPTDGATTAVAGSVFVQDAQLEQGLVARDYIETTTAAVEGGITDNVPRLDYTDSSCPALLLEPQRTNIVPHSEYINDASWGKNVSGGTLNVTSNYGISPDGSKNATRIEASLTSGYADIVQVLGTSSGTAYTYSVYLKSLSGTPSIYFIYDGTANRLITLTTEWKKYTFKIPSAPTIIYPRFLIEYGLTSSSIDILAYGAQLEQGSYATSYIPTYGTSVTRSADSCLATSISDLIGQTEGTLFVEYNSNITEDDSFFLVADDGTINNRIVLYSNTPNKLALVVNNGGVLQVVIANITLAAGTNKFAVGYATNDVVLYLNGTQVGIDNTAMIPATSALRMGTDHTAADFASGKATKQALVFKTRLSNEELAALTTI